MADKKVRKVRVEELVRQADNVLFWVERVAVLAMWLVPEYTGWLILCFVLTNVNTSIAAHLFKREFPFLIERVAAVFLALSHRAPFCRHLAFVIFGLSTKIYVINFMERQFNFGTPSRTGGTENRDSESKDDPPRKESELNRRAPEKDNDAGDEEASETGTRKKSMSLFERLRLALENPNFKGTMFFLERLSIFVLMCLNSRFPWGFTVFFGFSNLLQMLSLDFRTGVSPKESELMFRIERGSLFLSGMYYIGGSRSFGGFLAVGIFALSNIIHTINVLAPEQAGRMVKKITSLCSREISNNEKLIADQVKIGAENVGVDEGGSDKSKMEEDKELVDIEELTWMFLLEIFPIIIFVVNESACYSIFFWINILCGHHFPREPYIFFTDRVVAVLISVSYGSGSLSFGHLAFELAMLSNVMYFVTEIREGMGAGVQKNVGPCSRTCSPNPKESKEREDEPLLEDREASEDEGNVVREEEINDNDNGSNEINNDLNTATRENEKDEEFEQNDWVLCASDSGIEGNTGLQTPEAFNGATDTDTDTDTEELWAFMKERTQHPWVEELVAFETETFPVAVELSKEVPGDQVKDSEKLEDDQKDSSAARTHASEEDSPQWEEEKKDLMAKLTAATEASEHIRRCYEEQTHKWEEEKKSLIGEHNAEISSLHTLLDRFLEQCKKLEKEKSDLVVKLRAADGCHEHDQGIISNYELHLRNSKAEYEKIADELDEATKSLEVYRGIQEQLDGYRLKFEEEKAELKSKLAAATSHQKLLEAPLDQRQEDEERNNTNASKLSDAVEFSESSRARVVGAAQTCQRLQIENFESAARLNKVTSSNESFHRRVRGLEEKCCALEIQINNLTIALSTANDRAELYRELLHNVGCR